MKNVFSTLMPLVVFLGYFVLFSVAKYYLTEVEFAGFKETDSDLLFEYFLKPSIIGLFTVIGIFSKILFDEVEKSRKYRFSFKRIFRESASSRSLWIVILACPIVILAIYQSVEEIENLLLIGLLSYQNGFFFKTIIKDDDEE